MGLTDSQIAMWETVVALVHADGKVHEKEDAFLVERFEKLPITPLQKERLEKHLKHPGDPKELFKNITEPRDRSQLIYFARLLCLSDGDFNAQEKHVFELLHSEVMSKVDMSAAMHKLDKIVEEQEAKLQANRDAQPLHRQIINTLIFWEDLDNLD